MRIEVNENSEVPCLTSAYAVALLAQLQVPFNRTVESERKTKTWREHMVFHHFYLRCYHPFSLAMTLLPVHDLLISTLKVLFESELHCIANLNLA